MEKIPKGALQTHFVDLSVNSGRQRHRDDTEDWSSELCLCILYVWVYMIFIVYYLQYEESQWGV